MKKLHLGCGKCYLPPEEGWINIDFFSNTKADAYYDVTSLPYEKQSFDLIYASHLLEHVHRHAVIATLSHWRSLLKPGGILRLAVPNFEAVCERYKETGDLKEVMGLIFGGQDSYLNRHTVTFDKTFLSQLLIQANFSSIQEWDWRKTEHSKFDDFASAYLPHLDKVNGRLMSLNLEATR